MAKHAQRQRKWRRGLAVLLLIVVAAISGSLLALIFAREAPPSPKKKAPKITINKLSKVSFTPGAKKPVRFLLLGSDSRTESFKGLSDSIMIVQINPDKSANLVSFPRDSYVEIPGYGSQKINAALSYGGPELAVQTIENYSGLEMDYYLVTNFASFIRMIDKLGGVKISLDQPVYDSWSGANFSAGIQRLDGGQTLALARSRHITGGDFSRAANHQRIAQAVLKQESARRKTPFEYLELLPLVTENIESNLSFKEMFDLARLVFSVDQNRIESIVLEGSTGMTGGASVVFLDEDKAQEVFTQLSGSTSGSSQSTQP